MRAVVSGFASSLDGYIEGPNGEYDWIVVDKEIDFAEQMKRYDAFLYGRRTYESVKKMGPNKDKSVRHYVISNSLQSVDEGYTLMKGDIASQIKKIKEDPGKDIAVFGGASLLASLFDMNLVDELSIAVIPVLLGKGKPMVEELAKHVKLELIKTHAYSNGTVQLTYKVKSEK